MIADHASSLMATHARLRANRFGITTVVSARTALDARVWLGAWCRANDRILINATSVDEQTVLRQYLVRLGATKLERVAVEQLPTLLVQGDLKLALMTAASLTQKHPQLPVALACGLAEIVDGLLDTSMPIGLVSAALEGLIPTADTERQVLKTVAEGRKVQPFLRGACEGLVYYMLEARPETRGHFGANARVPNPAGGRSYEIDILCERAKLVIEIDGPEHEQSKRKDMDARKQTDLERLGYRVRRFSNSEVVENPVGVWRLIHEQLADRLDN